MSLFVLNFIHKHSTGINISQLCLFFLLLMGYTHLQDLMKFSSALAIMCFVAFIAIVAAQKATYREDVFEVYEASFPEENILPTFMFSQGSVEGGGTQFVLNPNGGRGTVKPSSFDDSLPDYYLEGLMTDVRSPVLPYRLQSHWRCDADKTVKKRQALILENDNVSMSVTPEVNGKIWSMYDKINKREMIQDKSGSEKQRNFANIGTHKKWASGGVEWNWSPGIIGHSAFAERDVYAAKFDTERGPVIRVWEFDRFNASTWQVDMLLQDNIVWVHPYIMNPHEHELPAYWWTCVAHFARGKDRFLSPATGTGQTEAGPTRYSTWPYMAGVLNSTFKGGNGEWQIDHSFMENIVWGDFFVDVPEDLDKWVQLTNEDGYSVFHGHPNKGSKIFVWGNNGNARFMQRFLANFPEDGYGDSGNYVELQTGLMKTQSQQGRIPAATKTKVGSREWTEYFTAWVPKDQSEIDTLRGDVYSNAVNLTHDRSLELIPSALRDEMDQWFNKLSTREIKKEEIISYGSPWGALHNLMLKQAEVKEYPKSTPFGFGPDDKPSQEALPWYELLTTGTFSPQSLSSIPTSFQVGEQWRELLEASINKYGATWLHLFHLSVIEMEKGEVELPRILLKQSISLKPTPHAYRSLALLSKNEQEALPLLHKAWDLALSIDQKVENRDNLLYYLGSEIISYLQQAGLRNIPGFRNELKEFMTNKAGLVQELTTTDQYISAEIAIAIWFGKPQQALDILSDDSKNCFPTYGRQRNELISYWNQANIAVEAEQLGRPLTLAEQRNVRMGKPQPRRIGCAYSEFYCLNYW